MMREEILTLDFSTHKTVFAVVARQVERKQWQAGVQLNDDTPVWYDIFDRRGRRALEKLRTRIVLGIADGETSLHVDAMRSEVQ